MVEGHHRVKPQRAAEALNTKTFAFQILRRFDPGAGHEFHRGFTGEIRNDRQIHPACRRTQRRAGSDRAHVNIAGNNRGDERGAAADQHNFAADTVLLKKTLLLGDPERRQAG